MRPARETRTAPVARSTARAPESAPSKPPRTLSLNNVKSNQSGATIEEQKGSQVKRHHVAVLALMGWQLLSSPFNSSTESYDPDAPLREWKVWKTLDSQSACKQVLSRFNGASLTSLDPAERSMALMEQTPGFKFECVATDDLRLKNQ